MELKDAVLAMAKKYGLENFIVLNGDGSCGIENFNGEIEREFGRINELEAHLSIPEPSEETKAEGKK